MYGAWNEERINLKRGSDGKMSDRWEQIDFDYMQMLGTEMLIKFPCFLSEDEKYMGEKKIELVFQCNWSFVYWNFIEEVMMKSSPANWKLVGLSGVNTRTAPYLGPIHTRHESCRSSPTSFNLNTILNICHHILTSRNIILRRRMGKNEIKTQRLKT